MRIHHVGVLVEDFEAGKTFARDVLGLGEPQAAFEADEIGLAGAFFGMGDGLLEIFTIAEGRKPDGAAALDHIAVTVEDLDAEQERLAAHGVRFTGPTTADEITEPFELRGNRHLWTDPATSGGVRYQITQSA
jgi:catechol 2,3-dioxygenase-like lactoylglutathione lyase family enzyme